MASARATATGGRLPNENAPHRNIMTSFRPLPNISEQEQEHLISLAMEATGLKQYQRWDTVEYTIIDSIKNGWQLLLQKARRSFTGKKPTPDAAPNETRRRGEDEEDEEVMVIAHVSPDSKSGGEVQEEGEEGWTVLH